MDTKVFVGVVPPPEELPPHPTNTETLNSNPINTTFFMKPPTARSASVHKRIIIAYFKFVS
jgi:hypothetical protein